MASLSIPRPRKVSERQYLGDLTSLFERQRRRYGLALTQESFAADLSANDSLRSGLFTLCTAISHMGQDDLSGEELLALVARALGSAEDSNAATGAAIPDSMRAAFLNGYGSWSHRETDLSEPLPWPPFAPDERKPPARAESPGTFEPSHEAASNSAEPTQAPISSPGRRTVQEALSLARKEPSADPSAAASPAQRRTLLGENGEYLGSMTLSELKNFLEDIEDRVNRLGPHLEQLKAAVHPAANRAEKADSFAAESPIPFPEAPARRARVTPIDSPTLVANAESSSADFNLDAFVRGRPSAISPQPSISIESAFSAPHSAPADDRPPGIDALLAAAPAWANASPSSRKFDEDAFLARHAYLAPSRRPGGEAPASLFYAVTPAAPLAPPVAALPVVPSVAPTVAQVVMRPAVVLAARPVPALVGLDAEDDPLLSPMEHLQALMLRLHPRRVFSTLTALTVMAGVLAGIIAYRSLNSGRTLQFKDLERSTSGLRTPASASAATPAGPAGAASGVAQTTAAATPAPASSTAAPLAASAMSVASNPPAAASVPAHSAPASKWKPRAASPQHKPSVAVWPPVPAVIAHETPSAPPPAASAAPSTRSQSTVQASASDPILVSPSTMMAYAVSAPQPVYPVAQAKGASGTVVMQIVVSRLGDVISARAVSGPAELRPAAAQAVRLWRFRPHLVNGTPAEVTTTLQFTFKGQ